jgi:CRISPR/Cas system-associated protein Csx1
MNFLCILCFGMIGSSKERFNFSNTKNQMKRKEKTAVEGQPNDIELYIQAIFHFIRAFGSPVPFVLLLIR